MRQLLLVGAGGFLGSIGRFLAGGAVQRLTPAAAFPYGTLFVNVTGCLAIGFLASLAATRGILSGDARAFLLIGVLGGFTTFSTFAYETHALAVDAQFLRAATNAVASLGGCLAAVWLGDVLAKVL